LIASAGWFTYVPPGLATLLSGCGCGMRSGRMTPRPRCRN
jgi:hypothetical protein